MLTPMDFLRKKQNVTYATKTETTKRAKACSNFLPFFLYTYKMETIHMKKVDAGQTISLKVQRYGLDIDSAMLVGHGHRVPNGISEKMRADAFEAIIGAIYILYGLEDARKVVEEVLF